MEEIKYIAGNFCIQADAAFINGAGIETASEDRNVTVPKTMWKNGKKIPYVSSQAWKRYLRETMISETNWPQSQLRAIGWNSKGNTSKIAGMLNPVDFREDDIFGYMFAKGKSAQELPKDATDEQKAIGESLPTVQIKRTSTFLASLLYAVQDFHTLNQDEAFVHLKEGTPIPYTTEFYNADLQAIFGIDYERLGVFDNKNETDFELDPKLANESVKNKKITIVGTPDAKGNNIYQKANLKEYKKETVSELLKALAVLRGGAKATQFGTDISPKALVLAGLNSKNPFLNNIFFAEKDGIILDLKTLEELVKDYAERIETKVYIGIRSGYFKNEQDILKLNKKKIGQVELVVGTPIEVVEQFIGEL